MKTINIIQCPYCSHFIEPWDFIDTGDMDGEFTMKCEKCEKEFLVKFETDIKFTTDIM